MAQIKSRASIVVATRESNCFWRFGGEMGARNVNELHTFAQKQVGANRKQTKLETRNTRCTHLLRVEKMRSLPFCGLMITYNNLAL
jgi:hypothetical protein